MPGPRLKHVGRPGPARIKHANSPPPKSGPINRNLYHSNPIAHEYIHHQTLTPHLSPLSSPLPLPTSPAAAARRRLRHPFPPRGARPPGARTSFPSPQQQRATRTSLLSPRRPACSTLVRRPHLVSLSRGMDGGGGKAAPRARDGGEAAAARAADGGEAAAVRARTPAGRRPHELRTAARQRLRELGTAARRRPHGLETAARQGRVCGQGMASTPARHGRRRNRQDGGCTPCRRVNRAGPAR